MRTLTDILNSGLFIDSDGCADYRTGKVRQEIKDLMQELIGENESVSQADHGTDWEYHIHGANALREVLRRKVDDL